MMAGELQAVMSLEAFLGTEKYDCNTYQALVKER